MKKLKWIISYIFYNMIAKHLPCSSSPINFGAKKIRGKCVKNIIRECGTNVNIEKGAKFSRKTKLGDNSGIGINAKLHGEVIIGKNVMMGPDCIIYTQNHEFSNINIPMCEQGFQAEKPV